MIDYAHNYPKSIRDRSQFWAEVAHSALVWRKTWDNVTEGDFAHLANPSHIHDRLKWFVGGKLNLTESCLDRHLEKSRDKTAIIWVGNETNERRTLTYGELTEAVCRFAQGLKSLGVTKGDRVAIYMPMVPEAAIAMLATARIGAIHSVVFGGFSAKSLRERIDDSGAKLLITADQAPRGHHKVELKAIADEALAQPGHSVEQVIVLPRSGAKVHLEPRRDILWNDVMKRAAHAFVKAEEMDAEDPLFILYTSGSTGRPKGLMHTTAGYGVYVASTFRWIFGVEPNDVYWCTADVGWVTGHSYIVYGPLANGTTALMFEGTPVHPEPDRFWREIAANKVTIFYTAPTALRALMKLGDAWVKKHDLSSLRLLGSVGEPINPAAWEWYAETVGGGRLPIVDTWWQTETGGIMISPIPHETPQKPGLATRPLFGIEPALLDVQSTPGQTPEVQGPGTGALVIKHPWPGMARSIWGDHQRFVDTYLKVYPGYYCTGDGAERDTDGDYLITGRMDDVINVSGHRLGTFEIESALVSHKAVAESAVIGISHDIKGQAIYAFVTLKEGHHYKNDLKKELIQHVRQEIGPIATPERIHWAPALPKTRSGKIMRRILRKIAARELDSLGDTSTLADPKVIDQLLDDL